MKFIGRIADGSTETSARVILLKDLEREITTENLVLIKNGGDEKPSNQILGVLRGGLGKNEFLSHTSYRPDVAYMKYGGEPSGAREVFSFYKDLFNAINIIAKKVKIGGYVCFVVGNRRVKKEELPTDKISADFFEQNGFLHQRTIVRAISNKRMPIENSPTNIRGEKDSTMRYEYIVILRREE